MENRGKGRTLVYTVCDDDYAKFIPLLIMSHMMYNNNIDIEISVNVNKLNNNTEKAISILQNFFKEKGVIKINYNTFQNIDKRNALYKGKKMLKGTLRWLIEPTIKDEYTYITDIDIACLEPLFNVT